MWWRLLVGGVVALHFAYLALIPIGGFLAGRWRWVLPVHVVGGVVPAPRG